MRGRLGKWAGLGTARAYAWHGTSCFQDVPCIGPGTARSPWHWPGLGPPARPAGHVSCPGPGVPAHFLKFIKKCVEHGIVIDYVGIVIDYVHYEEI